MFWPKSVCVIWAVFLLVHDVSCYSLRQICAQRCLHGRGGILCRCNAMHFTGKRSWHPQESDGVDNARIRNTDERHGSQQTNTLGQSIDKLLQNYDHRKTNSAFSSSIPSSSSSLTSSSSSLSSSSSSSSPSSSSFSSNGQATWNVIPPLQPELLQSVFVDEIARALLNHGDVSGNSYGGRLPGINSYHSWLENRPRSRTGKEVDRILSVINNDRYGVEHSRRIPNNNNRRLVDIGDVGKEDAAGADSNAIPEVVIDNDNDDDDDGDDDNDDIKKDNSAIKGSIISRGSRSSSGGGRSRMGRPRPDVDEIVGDMINRLAILNGKSSRQHSIQDYETDTPINDNSNNNDDDIDNNDKNDQDVAMDKHTDGTAADNDEMVPREITRSKGAFPGTSTRRGYRKKTANKRSLRHDGLYRRGGDRNGYRRLRRLFSLTESFGDRYPTLNELLTGSQI